MHTDGPHLYRAQLLLSQGRHREAEEAFRRSLAEDPEHPVALMGLALCLSRLERREEAYAAAWQAIQSEPAAPAPHHVMAIVLSQADRLKEALPAVEYALSLDPEEPEYHGTHAAILFDLERWPESLAAAERGLALDGEHEMCANLRAMALTKLGRHGEASETMRGALARDPHDALAHANLGWTHLHRREYKAAQDSFREALRLQPGLDYARAGLVETLRARNWLYRPLLWFFLAMQRLPQGAQWGVILGVWLLGQALSRLSGVIPLVVLVPAGILLGGFVLMTWIAQPLMDLTLLLHPVGKYALTRIERLRAQLFAAFIVLGIAGVAVGLATDILPLALFGIASIVLLMPLAAAMQENDTRRQRRLFLSLFAVATVAAWSFALLGNIAGMIGALAVALIGFSWGTNIARSVARRAK